MLDEILRYLDMINLSNSGSIASIASFILTLFILFYGIRAIKQFYVFIGRVPVIIDDLDKIASKISYILNDFEGSRAQIPLILASAYNYLTALKTKIKKRKSKKSINTLIKTINNYNSKSEGEKKLRRIHVDLHKIIGEIRELQKDQKWEK